MTREEVIEIMVEQANEALDLAEVNLHDVPKLEAWSQFAVVWSRLCAELTVKMVELQATATGDGEDVVRRFAEVVNVHLKASVFGMVCMGLLPVLDHVDVEAVREGIKAAKEQGKQALH